MCERARKRQRGIRHFPTSLVVRPLHLHEDKSCLASVGYGPSGLALTTFFDLKKDQPNATHCIALLLCRQSKAVERSTTCLPACLPACMHACMYYLRTIPSMLCMP